MFLCSWFIFWKQRSQRTDVQYMFAFRHIVKINTLLSSMIVHVYQKKIWLRGGISKKKKILIISYYDSKNVYTSICFSQRKVAGHWALFICQNNNKLTRSFNVNLLNLRLQKSYPFILTRIQLHTLCSTVYFINVYKSLQTFVPEKWVVGLGVHWSENELYYLLCQSFNNQIFWYVFFFLQ